MIDDGKREPLRARDTLEPQCNRDDARERRVVDVDRGWQLERDDEREWCRERDDDLLLRNKSTPEQWRTDMDCEVRCERERWRGDIDRELRCERERWRDDTLERRANDRERL